MIRRRLAAVLTACCLASLGCAGGLGCRGPCGDECATGCNHGCGFAGMTYECCETACCSGGNTACGDCADGCTGACGDRCHQPCVRTLLEKLCGCTGCDELYWNEWHCDPPACREPCDCMGTYTGKRCDACRR